MTHIKPPKPWLATFVQRWHSGPSAPWLARTNDRNGRHSGCMAVLALNYFGDAASRELLVACILHDLGEYDAADIPATAKRKDPTLKGAISRIEDASLASMGLAFSLSLDDRDRLEFLDRLEPYLWAQHHAPQLMDRADWLEDRRLLDGLARRVGVDLYEAAA